MALVQKSPEVFLAEGPISEVGQAELDTLKAAVKASAKRRARINAHVDGEDALHEMIIAIDATSYIRPHKHPGKSEAFHIVEGEVDIVVFADDGEIERIVALGPPGGARPFYYRMSQAVLSYADHSQRSSDRARNHQWSVPAGGHRVRRFRP